MSGAGRWWTLGAAGLLAALGASRRGAANRKPSAAVLSALRGHPRASEIAAYLESPSLEGWREIRGYAFGGVTTTLWKLVARYAWYSETGRFERPPFGWMERAEGAYPDDARCFPPPVVLEKAMLMGLGRPVLVQAGSEAPVCPTEEELEAGRVAPEDFGGATIRLYRGENPTQRFWKSEVPEVGLGALIVCPKHGRRGCSVLVIEHGELRTLGWYPHPGSSTIRTTGGIGVEDAVAAAWKRHRLDLVLSQEMHWWFPPGEEEAVLRPGPFASGAGSRSRREPSWLDLEVVRAALPAMKRRRVSRVARGPRGFVRAYRQAGGDPEELGRDRHSGQQWRARRNAFLARHLAQIKNRGESLWEGGEPTRRHLALIAWAHSPEPRKVQAWLDRRGSRAAGGPEAWAAEALAWLNERLRGFGAAEDPADLPLSWPEEHQERLVRHVMDRLGSLDRYLTGRAPAVGDGNWVARERKVRAALLEGALPAIVYLSDGGYSRVVLTVDYEEPARSGVTLTSLSLPRVWGRWNALRARGATC